MKIIVFTAPSGAGKTTIVQHLLQKYPDQLAFSVSATTRPPRPNEVEGKDYYFLSPEAWTAKVANGEFVEWEEVYENRFYGTLRSEVERLRALGKTVVFDIEVKGATSIKRLYGSEALVVFVKPPSKEVLFERLRNRKTENAESLTQRLQRAGEELEYENNFDVVLLNDDLKQTLQNAEQIIENATSNQS